MAPASCAQPITSSDSRSLTIGPHDNEIGLRLRALELLVRSLEDAPEHAEFPVDRPRL